MSARDEMIRKHADKLETKKKRKRKVAKVMHEFSKGELHSGSKNGPKVTNRFQAIAIALNSARKG